MLRNKKCPLLRKPCIEHECMWWSQIQGKHPQTGADMDKWGCAIEWMPILLVENSGMQRQTGAAIESFRNEMVKSNEEALKLTEERLKLPNAT